jgi:hypothetical protein
MSRRISKVKIYTFGVYKKGVFIENKVVYATDYYTAYKTLISNNDLKLLSVSYVDQETGIVMVKDNNKKVYKDSFYETSR